MRRFHTIISLMRKGPAGHFDELAASLGSTIIREHIRAVAQLEGVCLPFYALQLMAERLLVV